MYANPSYAESDDDDVIEVQGPPKPAIEVVTLSGDSEDEGGDDGQQQRGEGGGGEHIQGGAMNTSRAAAMNTSRAAAVNTSSRWEEEGMRHPVCSTRMMKSFRRGR